MRQVTAYFGLSCLIAAVLAPVFGVLLLVKGGSDPAINGVSGKVGEAIAMIRPTSLWAQPAELNDKSITCVASEFGGTKDATLRVGDAPASSCEKSERLTPSGFEFGKSRLEVSEQALQVRDTLSAADDAEVEVFVAAAQRDVDGLTVKHD